METAGYYDSVYYDGSGKSNYVGYTEESSPFITHADMVETVLRHFGLDGPVLDAGCAKGYLVRELRRRGIAAYGVDWSTYAVDRAGEDIRGYLCAASVCALPFRAGHFALVVSFDLLEHLDVPHARQALAECARVGARQLHQVNTGRLPEWRYESDDSHCTRLSVDRWRAMAAELGLAGTVICEPDGKLPFAPAAVAS